jgi:hypothetical protein
MAELAVSQTSELSKTAGKACRIGRFVTPEEGERIVQVAASWENTPYVLAGANSEKGIKGDCSGSSNKIYVEAGFPYPYQTSGSIVAYIKVSNRFKLIKGDESGPPQNGDLIVWPGGHIAIFAKFESADPRRKNKYGKENNMWSAHYPDGPAYSAERAEGFRKQEKFFFYRYYLLPGDPGCT